MKPGALIIEGHIQGLSNVRALGQRGIPVYVCDTSNCLARYSRYCLKFFRCPPYASGDFITFLTELAERENLFGWVLLPSNDHIVTNISRNAGKLSDYYKTTVPSWDILDRIVNKRNLLCVASKAGVRIPVTYNSISDVMEREGSFPLLIKGIYGLSFYKSRHVKAFRVNSADELVKLWPTLPDANVMIQELIPDTPAKGIISFTCFAVNGDIKTYWIGEKLREHPYRFGTATYSASVENRDVSASAKSLISALNYTGVCEVEYMFDPRDEEYKLIEVNPRTWLWVGLARACGVDYALLTYNYLNDIPNEYPSEYEPGLKWINGITDLCFSLYGIFKGFYRIGAYLKSLRGKKVRAVWSWDDVMPGLMFPIMSFYIFRKRK